MGVIAFKLGDDFTLKLSRIAANSEEIAKKAIYAGADILADEIRKRLEDNLADPSYTGKGDSGMFGLKSDSSTGELLDSFGITPISKDKNLNWTAKVGFDGYDSDGVPNQLKARVMESGSSTIKKRPFVRPAINAKREAVKKAMENVVDEEIKKL